MTIYSVISLFLRIGHFLRRNTAQHNKLMITVVHVNRPVLGNSAFMTCTWSQFLQDSPHCLASRDASMLMLKPVFWLSWRNKALGRRLVYSLSLVRRQWRLFELYRMVLPVFMRTHWGRGRFCVCLRASFILMRKVLWAAIAATREARQWGLCRDWLHVHVINAQLLPRTGQLTRTTVIVNLLCCAVFLRRKCSVRRNKEITELIVVLFVDSWDGSFGWNCEASWTVVWALAGGKIDFWRLSQTCYNDLWYLVDM